MKGTMPGLGEATNQPNIIPSPHYKVPARGKNQGKRGFFCKKKSGNLGKIGEIRGENWEFFKNMSGKYQGIFNIFHDIKITEMILYEKKILPLLYLCQTRYVTNGQ